MEYSDDTILKVKRKSDSKEFTVTVKTEFGRKGFRIDRTFWYADYFLRDHEIIGDIKPKLYTIDDMRSAYCAGQLHIINFDDFIQRFNETT